MNDFHLILSYYWFDMIEQGRKNWEYRRKEYWLKRMKNWIGSEEDRFIVFHRGYTNQTMRFKVGEVNIGDQIEIHLKERVDKRGEKST